MYSFLSFRRGALLGTGLALLLGLGSALHADSYYTFKLDTSAYTGQSAVLAFDLIDGDGAQNNTALITQLWTDGSLTDASNVTVTDTSFFNEELRDIVLGSWLSFSVHLTENFAGGSPDGFSFFLLDSTATLPLFATAAPDGSDALAEIAIDGSKGGVAQGFAGRLAVPDTGSTLALFSMGAMGLVGFSRRFRRATAA